MTVIKNQKSNTYEVRTYYKDWTGVRKQKTKRGFKRKCDAQEWERAFKLKENLSLDMYFEDFVDLYLNDIKSRIKYNTWLTKKHIVEKKILPYFSKKKLQEIKPSDIRQWQNTMMNYRNKQGEGYSQVYLKTIHNQLSAILNHAVNFYDLKSNAARKAGSMGKERTKEMLFWTKEEYMKFIEAVADKPISFYAFEILYWCGVRMGELLALTPADFDFQACTIRINKSYQRLEGKDIVTDPKTVKSNRMITMPEFLSEELEAYIGMLYGLNENELYNNDNNKKVVEMIYREKNTIVKHFKSMQEDMFHYIRPMIEGAKKILVVDLGWYGTGGIAVKYLLEEKYKLNVKVISALVGTNEDASLAGRISAGLLFPYAYSPLMNLYLLHWHTRHQYNIHNLLIELLFSAPYPSFLGFEKDNSSNPRFGYDEKDNYFMINEMHCGIMKFAELYNELNPEIRNLLSIHGVGAYAGFM